ncbi:MAG: DNA polymerase III subunit [Planctomycetes bacterium]|nr:DNA polymerase III subunit [Planctomycetota bacterium]
MSIKEIFCQDKAVDILQRAFASGKWAHAYIFAGPEGVGKFKTAREWAKLLLCQKPVRENDFADSCGVCRACELFEAGSHPDFNHIYKELLEFTKDGKSKAPPVDLPISVIREFLVEKVSNRPTLSERKVFVISEAERLNNSSQNALLKVLEEPPEYCSIILLCSRFEKLLPTTKSRSQILRFGTIDEDHIIEKLQQTGLEETQGRYFGRLAQGSLGTAYQWAKLELAQANLYETKKELISSLASYEIADALSLAEKSLNKCKNIAAAWTDLDKVLSKKDINRRAAKTIVQIIISALYDVMNLTAMPTKEAINFDQKEKIQKLAGRFDAELAAEKISDCYKMLHWIESSVNEKLIFEHLLLNLAESDRIGV